MGRLEERFRKCAGTKGLPQKKSDQDAAAAATAGHRTLPRALHRNATGTKLKLQIMKFL